MKNNWQHGGNCTGHGSSQVKQTRQVSGHCTSMVLPMAPISKLLVAAVTMGVTVHKALKMTQKYSSASSEESLPDRLILFWRWFQMIQWSICQISLCTVIRDLAENFWHGKVTNSWRWWWGKRRCSYLLNPHVMRKPHISASDCFLRAEVFNKQDLIRKKYNRKFLQ